MALRTGLLVAALLPSMALGSTYTVTNAGDAGAGSLRQAITDANAHGGADRIVFDATMDNAIIRPGTPLPTITDGSTVIDGDINDDGWPDVFLDGSSLPDFGPEDGLVVEVDECRIIGLGIGYCNGAAVRLVEASYCQIRACHLGATLPGNGSAPNRWAVIVEGGHDNQIGLTGPNGRNVIGTVLPGETSGGIRLVGSSDNTIVNNCVGVARLFPGALGVYTRPSGDGRTMYLAIALMEGADPCERNRIGGLRPAERNIVGGADAGVYIESGRANVVEGNYIGVGQDGTTVVPIGWACVAVSGTDNQVGDGEAGARNVLAGGALNGVIIGGPDTSGNLVQGNYFGLNAAGTEVRELSTGVYVMNLAGANTIGGAAASEGNYFAAKASSGAKRGVFFESAGANSTVRNNTFGVRPDGHLTAVMNVGIRVGRVSVRVVHNTIACAVSGLQVNGAAANPRVQSNTFRNCVAGVVLLDNSHCRLGNARTSVGEGRNVFDPSNGYHIANGTPWAVKAEGNDFGTTSKAAINAKIFDRRDDVSLGRVDFDPLIGGVSPTGETGPVLVSGATAVPTAGGAEIAFSLSAPAEVTVNVLNIAGRPVATVLQDRAAEAGLQRVVWNGRSAAGTRAPSGQYLVRVTARSADRTRSMAVATVSLR